MWVAKYLTKFHMGKESRKNQGKTSHTLEDNFNSHISMVEKWKIFEIHSINYKFQFKKGLLHHFLFKKVFGMYDFSFFFF